VRAGDGARYRVHTSHANYVGAAEAMAELNRRATELMRRLRARYLRGGAARPSPARALATRRLLALYNPDNLAENSPRDPEGDTSYTIDKGAVLALCLRERDPAASGDPAAHDLHDLEMLTFVLVHELAHVAIEDPDHPPRFWRAFRFLLEEAVAAGLLRGVDYARAPITYCGLPVAYNPLYDPLLRPLA
jgi:hypothetical protein